MLVQGGQLYERGKREKRQTDKRKERKGRIEKTENKYKRKTREKEK